MRRYNLTAIIYDKRDRVLSVGKNSYIKTHPLQAEYANKLGDKHKIYLHAEIHAIVRCKDLDRAYRIRILRTNNKGEIRLAKPCVICMEAIKSVGIKKIEYTTNA